MREAFYFLNGAEMVFSVFGDGWYCGCILRSHYITAFGFLSFLAFFMCLRTSQPRRTDGTCIPDKTFPILPLVSYPPFLCRLDLHLSDLPTSLCR